MTRDELISLVRTIRELEPWVNRPVEGTGEGQIILLPKVQDMPLPRPITILDLIRAFEERYNIKAPDLEALALDTLAHLQKHPRVKLDPKVTGDGSAWIVSTKFEHKNKSGDLRA